MPGKTIKLILDYLRIFLIDVVAAGLNISIHHKCRVIFAGWHDQVQCGLLAYLVDVVVVAPIISFHHNFIILLQGGTIKFIVDYLHIDRSKNAKKSLCEEINSKLFEHIMTGIEVQAFENQNNFVFAHIARNFMSDPLIASNLRTQ